MPLISRSHVPAPEATRLITTDELLRVFDREAILNAVRTALIDHAQGRTFGPLPSHILFDEPAGDCHVKVAGHENGGLFVVKLSCGFYGNSGLNLPTNSGLQILMSARTGHPVAVLDDAGLLTSWRTAAAAVEAASIVLAPNRFCAGVIGCGEQGELIARWLPDRMDVGRLVLWNRTTEKAHRLAVHLRRLHPDVTVDVVDTVREVIVQSHIAITATPSDQPLIHADMLQGPLHLITLGADAPGKSEVAVDVLAGALWVATDDHAQCLEHGEFGMAVRARARSESSDRSLGEMLAAPPVRMEGVSVVDLTGIAAQDLAIASLFVDRLCIVDRQSRPRQPTL